MAINDDNDIRYVYSCLKNIYATLDSKKEFGNLTKGSEELRIVPTPKPQNNFTSYDIQKAIVAFLEFWKDDFTDIYRSKIDIMKPMLDSMKQNLITSTFELDAKIVESFNEYALDKGFDIKLEDIEFEKITLSNQKFFEINPKKSEIDKSLKDINIDISFVPLEKIDPKSGTLDGSYSKKINDVIKGYTYFKEGDVIFTKVTPSMENGNIAIAQNLINGIGFGSSEYHVFRCKNIDNRLLWMLFRSDLFREKAKKTMKGSGGLKRVPLDFFDREYFHLPKHSVYESIELQNLLVEYWEMVLENFKEREDIFSRVLKLCEQIDEAFLYRTFSKIEWSR